MQLAIGMRVGKGGRGVFQEKSIKAEVSIMHSREIFHAEKIECGTIPILSSGLEQLNGNLEFADGINIIIKCMPVQYKMCGEEFRLQVI